MWREDVGLRDDGASPKVKAFLVGSQCPSSSSNRKALLDCSYVEANVVVTDFRGLTEIPSGNRFLVYTLFPEATVSVRLQWGPGRQVVMATAGHNIFERTSWSDIGQTMSLFGGGGHRGAGSCPLPPDDGDETLRRLVAELKRQG